MTLLFRAIGRLTRDDRWSAWSWEILGHLTYAAFAGALMMAPLALWPILWHYCQDACDPRIEPFWELPPVVLAVTLPLAGLMLMVNALVYQWAGWVRHNDTLKRDVRDYVIGFALGVVSMGIAALGIVISL